MQVDAGAIFGGLVDLAAAAFGGEALAANDEFFAGRDNLLKPGRGVFLPDAYTDQGKWMDGWESRRKRGPGHDACIIRLGVPGRVRALDIDTNHFLGNHPPFASVEGTFASPDTPVELLEEAAWVEIMPQQALRPGSQNLFAINDFGVMSHLRLNIFPDGGVARFRAYGEVAPGWHGQPDEAAALLVQPGEVDLAALVNGGKAIGCSDAFFGPMDNLIAPGRAQNMGGGWETRRRRGPGHDWIVVRLAAPGTIRLAEVDTKFFKGNFPDTCQIEGIYAPGARPTDVIWGDQAWQLILPRVKLAADTRHFFRDDLADAEPMTHVRLSIYPDGGISRLRLYGVPGGARRVTVAWLDGLPAEAAEAALLRCCGCARWAREVAAARPFGTEEALQAEAEARWAQATRAEVLEAIGHHPRIGADLAALREKYAATRAWSSAEQAGVAAADEATLIALRDGNVAYEARFGHVFLVCATGKTAAEMLALLQARLGNDPADEWQVARAEQGKITRIRLEKLAP